MSRVLAVSMYLRSERLCLGGREWSPSGLVSVVGMLIVLSGLYEITAVVLLIQLHYPCRRYCSGYFRGPNFPGCLGQAWPLFTDALDS